MISKNIYILSLLLFIACSGSFIPNERTNNTTIGLINKDNTEVKERILFNSKTIYSLSKNDKIYVLSTNPNKDLFKDLYGEWLFIKTNNDIKGFIFSSFVDFPNNNIEHFHIFINDFINSIKFKDKRLFYKSRLSFPLELYFNTGDVRYDKIINNYYENDSLNHFGYFLDYFQIKSSKLINYNIEYSYSCNGCGVVHYWYFKQQNKKWYCYKINISSN